MDVKGEKILEVWDYRLSTAVPVIVRDSGTWVVEIYSKSNPDYDPSDPATLAAPLETHDTRIEAEAGDEYDAAKVKACYAFLLSVRDNYAHPNIDELRPLVKIINEANQKLADLGAA